MKMVRMMGQPLDPKLFILSAKKSSSSKFYRQQRSRCGSGALDADPSAGQETLLIPGYSHRIKSVPRRSRDYLKHECDLTFQMLIH